MRKSDKAIIGRFEELRVLTPSSSAILTFPAKIDTGAYDSAIHATEIFVDDEKILHFILSGAEFATDQFEFVSIYNSFGGEEKRYLVDLTIELGGQRYSAPFSLADRSKKVFPALIGRTALSGRFLVDTAIAGIKRPDSANTSLYDNKDQEVD